MNPDGSGFLRAANLLRSILRAPWRYHVLTGDNENADSWLWAKSTPNSGL